MPPRIPPPPVTIPFHDKSPEERRGARRALRLRLLKLLDAQPMTVMALRLSLEPDTAGALVATLEDLVAAGEIAAIGHGAYTKVPWGPEMRPVVAAPLRDTVHGALVHLAWKTRRKSCSVTTVSEFLGLSLEEVALSLQKLELAGQASFDDATGEWRPVGTVTIRRVRKGIDEGIQPIPTPRR
ncbi:hypothetical protein [Asaia sp. VD9]|uniref:hypothetical protein n=1 Tax=Asaia sp. VD9 TaxID=3081235 RepID=UPI003015B623